MNEHSNVARMAQLVLQNVSYNCINGVVEKELLQNVSMYLHRGELCAVLGPSGAGKR